MDIASYKWFSQPKSLCSYFCCVLSLFRLGVVILCFSSCSVSHFLVLVLLRMTCLCGVWCARCFCFQPRLLHPLNAFDSVRSSFFQFSSFILNVSANLQLARLFPPIEYVHRRFIRYVSVQFPNENGHIKSQTKNYLLYNFPNMLRHIPFI